jgi:GNAT superfamily N-acetyltransferase
VFPKPWLDHQLADVLQCHWSGVQILPQDVLLVAREEGIVGFVAVWCRPDPFIANLHVKPSKRSRGIGSMLMSAAACRLIEQGHDSAYLWAVASNARAISFYEKLGGNRSEKALHAVYGHKVWEVKFVWNDISVLCREEYRSNRSGHLC